MRLLRKITGALAIAACAIALLPAEALANKDAQKQVDPEVIMAVFSKMLVDYHEKPDPKLALGTLRQFLSIPGHPAPTRAVSEAFVAGLISTTPDTIPHLAQLFDEQPDVFAMGLPRAILMSGRDDWADRIDQLKKLWPSRAKIIAEMASRGANPITSVNPLTAPGLLELQWAYYGATGSPKAVQAIISGLVGLDEKNDAGRLKVAFSAKYSIAAKASDSPKFAELCKPHLNGPHGVALKDALLAAETNNFDRLKDEATAAIHAVAPPPPPREEKVLRKNQR